MVPCIAQCMQAYIEIKGNKGNTVEGGMPHEKLI